MSFSFSKSARREFERIISRYPVTTGAILPILHLAQREFGCIDSRVIEYLAEIMQVEPAQLSDTISFYTLFKTPESGKYLIQVCQTLPCSLLGADHIVEYLKRKLQIDVGQTTSDGKFTLLKVECLGSCDKAPVMQVNDRYYEDLTEEKLDKILAELI
ncbi:MAG: NADH-quinone oxidoreductase subunit NuoE [Fidelibacterota bacterium]